MADYVLIDRCQICHSKDIKEIISLGDLPLVDALISKDRSTGEPEAKYPTPFLYCPHCRLCQLGCIVDQHLLFPLDYPYTGGTTKNLRDNFTELVTECRGLLKLSKQDLVVDIGCNDGTLLDNFKGHSRVLGITPENMGTLAIQKGISVIQSFWTRDLVKRILAEEGQAKVICATNVFAHFPDIHEAVDGILELLAPNGIFILECGYLPLLLEGLQYDSIHHEHLRYYTLKSLKYLFEKHGMEIIDAKQIKTHGGSLRVYVVKQGEGRVNTGRIERILSKENDKDFEEKVLAGFSPRVIEHRSTLHKILLDLKQKGKRIDGIGAPGRASVLINYAGIDERLLGGVLETAGSHKIGKCVPGTKVMIVDEKKILSDPPDYALMLSWHFAKELMPKLKAQGFRGNFIVPLPTVSIINNQSI